jgi:DNA-binding transcriptional ArsR family regulator
VPNTPALPDACPAVFSIEKPEALQALSHPTRIAMLEVLHEPRSAAAVGRELGQTRQRMTYHLKALEQAGLVERVGTRQNGNFIETLYRAAARAFVVSPQVSWSGPRRIEALRSQHALGTLVGIGEQLQRDAAVLLDRAAYESEQIASAAVSAEVSFASEAERSAFMREYLEATKDLLDRYGDKGGEPYRVVLAIHPQTEGSMQ